MDFRQPITALIPGVRGRILNVLVETDADLSIRAIARVANISEAQVSRIMPALEGLGIVKRTDVPPSVLYRLVRDNVVSALLVKLSNIHEDATRLLRRRAQHIVPPPAALVLFGSFVRSEAEAGSDLDVLVIRRDDIDEADYHWNKAMQAWVDYAAELTGLPVHWIEASVTEARKGLANHSDFWGEIPEGDLLVGELPPRRKVKRSVA